MTSIEDIARKFKIQGEIQSVKLFGDGLINTTYKIETVGDNLDYILQNKNHNVFPDVPAMMDNIVAVTEHLKQKVKNPLRETLTVIDTIDGRHYYKDENGNFWAVCLFIDETTTYNENSSTEIAKLGGKGIGRFQSLLSDFDKPLFETIKGFHNIRWRFQQWDESLEGNLAKRAEDVRYEIDFINSRREQMLDFWNKVEDGTIPRRVCHNDTKINNILFDKKSGDVLCVIDLDTVMSGTSLNDTGDALRSYTNTGKEDDRNPDNVSMDFGMFAAYLEGYLTERKDTLTRSETDYLAFSGLFITFEQTLRFLMDYLNGDTYYRIEYPEHNLVRTRAQAKLLQSMESQYERMVDYVASLTK